MYDVKRLIGRKFSDTTVQRDRKLLPYEIVDASGKPHVSIAARRKASLRGGLGDDPYQDEADRRGVPRPRSQARRHHGALRARARARTRARARARLLRAAARRNIRERPSSHHFGRARRCQPTSTRAAAATKDAGTIAGLKVERVINEPTAAAIAYGLDKESKGEENILVFDLGGGTFDVTLLTIDSGVFEAARRGRARAATRTLAARARFDQRLMDYCIAQFEKKHKAAADGKTLALRDDRRALQRLRKQSEIAKRALSSTTQTSIDVRHTHAGARERAPSHHAPSTRARRCTRVPHRLHRTAVAPRAERRAFGPASFHAAQAQQRAPHCHRRLSSQAGTCAPRPRVE